MANKLDCTGMEGTGGTGASGLHRLAAKVIRSCSTSAGRVLS